MKSAYSVIVVCIVVHIVYMYVVCVETVYLNCVVAMTTLSSVYVMVHVYIVHI